MQLWLGVVPEFTYEFIIVILLSSLIASFASPVTNAIQATGNIRNFQIGICLIFILEIPAAYLLLRAGASPYIALLPGVITQFLGVIFRFYILKKQVYIYNFRYFMIKIVIRSSLVLSFSYMCLRCFFSTQNKGFTVFLLSSIISFIFTALTIYILGLNKLERKTIDTYMKKIAIKTQKMILNEN